MRNVEISFQNPGIITSTMKVLFLTTEVLREEDENQLLVPLDLLLER